MSCICCLWKFAAVILIFVYFQGASCFFVKHVKTGLCVNDTSQIQSGIGSNWGTVSFVELTNNCLDPHGQFRFLNNGAMFNLKRKGCLSTHKKAGHGYYLIKFYIWVPRVGVSPHKWACAQKPDKKIYHAITQTPGGALSVYYKPYDESTWNTWCAVPKRDDRLLYSKGIDPYLGLTKTCDDTVNKRFNFGSVTCHGSIVKDANCPKDQYIVIRTAAYRGLPATKACGLSDDHSCETDETCLVKKLCDGQHQCNITVNDSVFPVKSCQGLTRYLYLEYQCINTPKRTAFCSAPDNINLTSRSTSSLAFAWDAPQQLEQDSLLIISYTVCVSHSKNRTCFMTIITTERKWEAKSLKASTKYFVRVLASNKDGSSNYSKSVGFFTNGNAAEKAISGTSSTLTFALEMPSITFDYFYVVVWKLKDDNKPSSADSYENDELVTYTEAQKSITPKAYIAAVIPSGLDGNIFVLGDGKNTSDPTKRRRRATTSDYYNGPLEPRTKYAIFQRIFTTYQSDYYSTDWSPVSKTKDYTGGPRVLANISSGDINAKEGDIVNLLCSVQGEPPVTFSWKKERKPLESFMETDKPHRSSLLFLRVKGQSNFGKYVCHIQDRFGSTSHTISILEDTGAETNCECSEKSGRKNGGSSGKWLAGIIVLTIVLAILLVIVAYFAHRFKGKAKQKTFENDNYDNSVQESADNCKNEQATNTNSRTSEEEGIADYSYTHLIQKDASEQ